MAAQAALAHIESIIYDPFEKTESDEQAPKTNGVNGHTEAENP